MRRSSRHLDRPWRPQPGIAHGWCSAGPVCEEIVPRDAGITDGMLAQFDDQRRERKTCPLCLALVYAFFGAEALHNAIRTRHGAAPEYDDDE